MKINSLKYILIVVICIISLNGIYGQNEPTAGLSRGFGSATTGRYAEKSVLGTGDWYKIRISQSGLHKINYEQLISMGVSSPENIRVYGYGGAQLPENFQKKYIDDLPQTPIYMEKGTDNVFGPGDFIIFYAQGPVSWEFDVTTQSLTHTKNTYSDYGYYFLTSSFGPATPITTQTPSVPTSSEIIDYYNHFYLHEIDRINIINSGKKFYNEEFNLSKMSHTFTVNLPNIQQNKECQFIINAAHKGVRAGNDYEQINVYINSQPIGYLKLGKLNDDNKFQINSTSLSFNSTTPNINIKLTYTNDKSTAYLDYFIIKSHRALVKESNSALTFNFLDKMTEVGSFTYQISNSTNQLIVWDITNLNTIRKMLTKYDNGKTTFVDKANSFRKYIAFDPKTDNFPTPDFVGKISNQNLHGSSQVDMIIISDNEFIKEAQRLAQAHYDTDNMTVIVTDAETVYNEFSSGTPDATAYRRFAKMFYDRATSEELTPKFLLLFGDGSFDNRKLLKVNTDKNVYRLLTYQSDNSSSDVSSYTSDDYFAFLDDNEGVAPSLCNMDIAVGRIPAYDIKQAKTVVDKTIQYIQNDIWGAWKNQGIFLADDGDNNIHIEGADSSCNIAQRNYPDFLTRKLFFDAYKQESSASGESYPVLKKEFLDYINSGILFINYMGHGGYTGWADELMLTPSDIDNMHNQRLPLWVAATCNFSRFDHFLESASEKLLTKANGGAIGVISAARTVIANQNNLINFELNKELLSSDKNSGYLHTIGQSLMKAKNKRAQYNDVNRMSYLLLGDPAVRLNYPTSHKVVVDSINGKSIKTDMDTLGALSPVVIKGYVMDVSQPDSMADQTFNGFVEVKIFDKQQTLKTLANDAGSRPHTYVYRTSPIYSGKANVENGVFTISFVVPKDIKYNFGTGKIVLYAADPTQGFDGNGHCENLIIGGENKNIIWETDGPDLSLYLNTPTFKNGDKVNENPMFVAHVADQSGINITGSGFGHDIILKLDNDPQQEYILNNYYETAYGSYTEGYVNYQLTNLAEGKHTLYFRIWDMQNNSSTATLNFEVVKGLPVNVQNISVYPNPATDFANIVIENDRPNQPADVQIYIYDYTGKKVWQNDGYYVTDNRNRISVQWDLNDSNINIVEGLYLVKAVVTDTNGEKDKKSTKILVQR